MLSFLNHIDTDLFLFLNSLHSEAFDFLMLEISYNRIIFAMIIIAFSIYGVVLFKKKYFIAFFFSLLAFGASDIISTRLFKANFERLRPCHNQVLKDKVHLAGRKCQGGKFGFISSHASNSFAIAMFFWLLFRKKNKVFVLLFFYAAVVSYSRIYLARHYPGDIFFGMILGLFSGWFFFRLYTKLLQNHVKNSE